MAKSVSIPIALSELKRSSLRRIGHGKKKPPASTPLSGFVILVERSGDAVRLYGTAAERAGLSIGDEIVAVNGMPIEGKKYAQVVEHIQECIRTKIVQLKVRRRALEIPTQGGIVVFGGGASTVITEAYLVSVDKDHIKEVTKRLKKEYPELRTYDMESIAASAPMTMPLPTTSTSTSAATPSPAAFQRGSLRRPETFELQERMQNKLQRQKENEFLRSSMRQSKRLQALAASVEVAPTSSKDAKPSSSGNPLAEVSGFDNQCFADSANSTRDDDDENLIGDHENNNECIELKQVIVSVERIAHRLSEMEGRESDVAALRQFFAAPPIQAAIEQTAAAMKNGDCLEEVPMTTFNGGASSSGIGSDGYASRTSSERSRPDVDMPTTASQLQAQAASPATSHSSPATTTTTSFAEKQPAVRVVTLYKDEDSYLGATVRNEENRIVVGRVVKGGIVERLGLFEEGDELLQLNGSDLRGKQIAEICELLRNLKGEVNFVVASPNVDEKKLGATPPQHVQHVRALFDYDPEDDVYVPCKELAMKFQRGDILHVLNTTDENWWQAYREGDDTTHSLAGLIPSSSFRQQVVMYAEEVERENGKRKDSKRKKKLGKGKEEIRKSADEESLPSMAVYSDMLTYEEVVLHLARSDRKRPIVLCGAEGVGCLKLRDKLLESDRQRFACPVPYTSRPPKEGEMDGVHYHFVAKQKFQDEAKTGKFVEFGEFQKHLYGTAKADIIRVVLRGKTCVMTLKTESLGAVRAGDVMPFIVFLAAPSLHVLRRQRECDGQFGCKDDDLKAILAQSKTIEQKYGHLFDGIIVNTDIDKSLAELNAIIQRLDTEPQWVPASWLP